MLQLTKIFHFEMAHAIHGYTGACKNIHGHSYKLYVTVAGTEKITGYLPTPGFIVDVKEIKALVISAVINLLDHKLVLSQEYLNEFPELLQHENLLIFEAEPSAENILIYIQSVLAEKLPASVIVFELKLYETNNSYVRWINTKFIS